MGRNLLNYPSYWHIEYGITFSGGAVFFNGDDNGFSSIPVAMHLMDAAQPGDYIAGVLHCGSYTDPAAYVLAYLGDDRYIRAARDTPVPFHIPVSGDVGLNFLGRGEYHDYGLDGYYLSFGGYIEVVDAPPHEPSPTKCARFFSIPSPPATHAARLRMRGIAHASELMHLGALGHGTLRLDGAAYGGIIPPPLTHVRGRGALRLRGTAHSQTLDELGALGRGVLRLRQTQQGATPPEVNHAFGEARLYLSGLAFAPQTIAPATHNSVLRLRGAANSASVVGSGRMRMRSFGWVEPDNGVGTPIYTGDDQILLLDTMAFGDTTPTETYAPINDYARLYERSRQPAQQRSGLHDRLDMSDTLYALYIALLGDGMVLDGQIQAEPLLRLHDRLLLIGEVTSSAEAWARITEALALGMGLDALQRVDLVDSVVLDDTAAYWLQEVAALLDRLLLASTLSAHATITLLLPDALITSDAAAPGAEMTAQLRDALGLVMHLWLDNGHYTAWTMNTDSRASTRYTQYPFNSFMRIDGRDYAASDDGVYRLGGDSDDGRPINAHIRLGMSALGSRLAKHVPSVYLGYTASGDLLLKVVTADHGNGERRADIYRLHAKGAASPREGRVQVGRGLNAVYWDFVIENVDGADFDLDVIEFMPLVVNRRVRGNAGGR